MNGYEMMAESYRQLVKHGEIDKETADKEIRVYDFLATCDSDDLCRMVDSSAFNDIIRAFVEMAVKNADIDEDSRNRFLRADKARTQSRQRVEIFSVGENTTRP